MAETVHIEPKGVHKLEIQYQLRSYGASEAPILIHLDLDLYLSQDRLWNWSFKKDDAFNPIFRRHLEHILCLSALNISPTSSQECRIPFVNDPTLESGSTLHNDL